MSKLLSEKESDELKKLGNRLYEIRYKTKLSEMEMAKKLGISRGTLRNYEQGITTPTYLTLKKYHEVFKDFCSYEYFFTGQNLTDKYIIKLYQSLSYESKELIMNLMQRIKDR